jgi:hypothetical protein
VEISFTGIVVLSSERRLSLITTHAPKLFRKLILLAVILAMLAPVYSARAEGPTPPSGEWGFIRWGMDWQKFHLANPRPIDIFVARLHRAEPKNTIETAIAMGTIAQGKETPSGMAARYNGAINYWDQVWGNRNDVAVAINGYFFDRDGGTGVPWSGVVNSGWYAHRFTDNVGDAGFAWTQERQAFIGSCVYHTGSKNEPIFENAGTFAPNIDDINVARTDEEFIVYTPQFDSDTNTDGSALELLVEMTTPSQILPKPAGAVGYIRRINKTTGSTPLYADYVVLSFWGAKRASVETRINDGLIDVGDKVTIYQEITDCDGLPTLDWTKTYASLGGDYHFLNNGVIRSDFSNPDANVPNSRTAVAYNADYVYFVVVDGFRPDSIGITVAELGNFLKNNADIQATDAVSLDSGTSSTMVINGAVVNNTYCNFTRDCGVAYDPAVEKASKDTILPPEQTYKEQWDDPTGVLEPLVGTGMLMVAVQPIAQSTTFTPTQPITTTGSVEVRLGPGTNYASLGSAPAGATGEVIANLSKLNGVMAKNEGSAIGYSFWWFVDVGDLAGWVPEESLKSGIAPPPPTPTPSATPSVTPTPVNFTSFLFMPTIPRALMSVVAAAYGTPAPYPR